MLFSNLSDDIIYHILLYTGIIKYRNGKYMNQISITDERYKLLQTLPKIYPFYIFEHPIYHHHYGFHISFKEREKKRKMFSISFDVGQRTVETVYFNLLDEQKNRHYMKYICSF